MSTGARDRYPTDMSAIRCSVDTNVPKFGSFSSFFPKTAADPRCRNVLFFKNGAATYGFVKYALIVSKY